MLHLSLFEKLNNYSFYTIELRLKWAFRVLEGFLLPPEEIIPCAKEIVAFHVAAAQQNIEEFSS